MDTREQKRDAFVISYLTMSNQLIECVQQLNLWMNYCNLKTVELSIKFIQNPEMELGGIYIKLD